VARYGSKAQSKVKRAMHERKHGELKSGRSGKKVTSRKQAIAIGLSEAREEGAKVPPKRGGKKKRATKKGATKKTATKKTAGRKKRASSKKGATRKKK